MPSDTFKNLSFERKMKIYKGALEYFGNTKFENAKVSEITEQIEVKRRTYYSYFDSLDDLYNYVFSYHKVDCEALFGDSNLVSQISEEGFTEEMFEVFETYYLSVICSEYGLRKLFEFINTRVSNERVILNVLVSVLKQYELGILNKEQVIAEVSILMDAQI